MELLPFIWSCPKNYPNLRIKTNILKDGTDARLKFWHKTRHRSLHICSIFMRIFTFLGSPNPREWRPYSMCISSKRYCSCVSKTQWNRCWNPRIFAEFGKFTSPNLIALYLCSAMCSVDPSIFCERIILNFEQTRSSICKYTKVRLAVWVCAEISNKNDNKF